MSDVGWSFLVRTSDTLRFRMVTLTDNLDVVGSEPLSLDTWHHVVATYDGTSNGNGMNVYLDGSLDNTGNNYTATGTIQNERKVTIGSESDGSGRMKGKISDVRIYDWELTSGEVSALFVKSSFTNSTTVSLSNSNISVPYDYNYLNEDCTNKFEKLSQRLDELKKEK